MATRRCTSCGINYPVIEQFRMCPIHEEATSLLNNDDPDEHWKARFESMVRVVNQMDEVTRPIPFARGVQAIEVLGPNGKLYFVDQSDLVKINVIFSRMQPAEKQWYLFELEDGWIYETQGFDESRRRWWVERVARANPDEQEDDAWTYGVPDFLAEGDAN